MGSVFEIIEQSIVNDELFECVVAREIDVVEAHWEVTRLNNSNPAKYNGWTHYVKEIKQ